MNLFFLDVIFSIYVEEIIDCYWYHIFKSIINQINFKPSFIIFPFPMFAPSPIRFNFGYKSYTKLVDSKINNYDIRSL